MSPENAIVALFEDSDVAQFIVEVQMKNAGHEILIKAKSFPSALQKIELFKRLEIDVALVDGNLDAVDTSGKDGEALAAAIKEKAPGVIIVGVGADPVLGAHTNVVKSEINSDKEKLGRVVRELEIPAIVT